MKSLSASKKTKPIKPNFEGGLAKMAHPDFFLLDYVDPVCQNRASESHQYCGNV